MFPSFRLAMTWVHTWFGLVLGFVLMVVFFFGSLSVFDREIDRWAIPETRFEPQKLPSFDVVLRPIFERLSPAENELANARDRVGTLEAKLPVEVYGVYTTHRDPVLSVYAEFGVRNNPDDPHDHVHGYATIDPRSGNALPDDRLALGSQFFYPMHYGLHLEWLGLGYWLVGCAALIMLVGLVSGIVIHKKLFREFFTLRPNKGRQRTTLDLHNLTGVVATPFHFMFAFTGLVIFAGIYFPVTASPLKSSAENHARMDTEAKGLPPDRAPENAALASVDAMVEEAKRRWAARDMAGDVGLLTVTHVGASNAYVSIYRAGSDRVALVGQAVHFEGKSGRVIYEEPAPTAVQSALEFLTGLHLQHFEHWLLRWFYVLGGLTGCICIATGLVFFVGKRKLKHATQGVRGARIVDALTLTSTTGMVVATLAILVANRLLPGDIEARASWEERVFWWAWLAAFLHAGARTSPVERALLAPAWREQCCAIAALAITAVVLNWLTTGDHLLRTVTHGYWPVAGVDLCLLAVALVASFAFVRLKQKAHQRHGEDSLVLSASASEVHG
jgi:uncharacterized iron-regulated membrane protein